jgi:ankyrin repeat protein
MDPLKAIHKAVMDNAVSTFSTELAAGNDIDAPGPEGMTPLHIAAHRGNVEFAKALLDKGVDIDPINVWGNTPLWVAVMERHLSCPDGSMIRLLLERGADPTRREGNNSPLELAKMVADYPPDLIEALESKAPY